MAQRYILIFFDFRLHYTGQLPMEKEILWRFCCGMEPTSMKKQLKIFLLEKQMILGRESKGEREREMRDCREERKFEGERWYSCIFSVLKIFFFIFYLRTNQFLSS
jgi:hypothetical protein